MASDVAIAIRQAEALARLQVAAAQLCARAGVTERELAPPNRYANVALALQLEAIAGLLEDLVLVSRKPVMPPRGKREVADDSAK
jgi:hypothetical protein